MFDDVVADDDVERAKRGGDRAVHDIGVHHPRSRLTAGAFDGDAEATGVELDADHLRPGPGCGHDEAAFAATNVEDADTGERDAQAVAQGLHQIPAPRSSAARAYSAQTASCGARAAWSSVITWSPECLCG